MAEQTKQAESGDIVGVALDLSTPEPIDNKECPTCSYDDPQGGSVDIGENKARQDCHCALCGAEWTDVYTISERIVTRVGGISDAH